MAINSPGPQFVQVHYHSGWGRHVQTLPINTLILPSVGHPLGEAANWAGANVDVETHVNFLVDKFAAISQAGMVWDQAIVFTQATPTSPALPRGIVTLAQTGALAADANAIAMQQTYTLFDTAFNTVKLVLLDMENTLGNFPLNYAGLNAAHKDIIDLFTNTSEMWASRAGLRPSTLRRVTNKRNDKLRKEYNLT